MKKILVPVVIAVVVLAGAAFAAAQMLTSSFSESGSISGTVREVVVRSDRGGVTLTSGARTEFDFESRYLFQRPKFEKHLGATGLDRQHTAAGSSARRSSTSLVTMTSAPCS